MAMYRGRFVQVIKDVPDNIDPLVVIQLSDGTTETVKRGEVRFTQDERDITLETLRKKLEDEATAEDKRTKELAAQELVDQKVMDERLAYTNMSVEEKRVEDARKVEVVRKAEADRIAALTKANVTKSFVDRPFVTNKAVEVNAQAKRTAPFVKPRTV